MTLKPFPYQEEGVERLCEMKRGFLADEQGIGKTMQALLALERLDAYPALVACPSSLKLNWRREAKKWTPSKTVGIIKGWPGDGAFDGDCASPDITVISYGVLFQWRKILSKMPWQAAVFDEFHYAKGESSKRSRAAKQVTKDVPVVFGLTGTPMPNRPKELVPQLEILDRLGEFNGKWEFWMRYCEARREVTYRGGKEVDYWYKEGAANLEELNEKLAPFMIRRYKKDVQKELPPRLYGSVALPLTNVNEYEDAEGDISSYLGKNLDENEALARLAVLRRLAAVGKLDAAIEWLEQRIADGAKVVAFAHHREVVEGLANHFGDVAVSVVGGMSDDDKQASVDAFQEGDDARLFIGNIKAAGVGLTLTAADTVAFLEYAWTPSDMDQCVDRCHRIGQDEPVNVYYLYAEDTVDEYMVEILDRKRKVSKAAIDGEILSQKDTLGYVMNRLLEE